MAQQVEHVLGKDEVAGSSPANSSTKYHQIRWYFSLFALNMAYLKLLSQHQGRSQGTTAY